jgi:uncharacterized membrane protein YcaP (DUF421 family)
VLATEPQALIEIVLRVCIVYVALLVMIRLAGRRALSDITPFDMVVLLLVSETVSPALTADDHSLIGGLVAAGTLIGLSLIASHLAFRSRKMEALMSGEAALLIRDGRVDERVLHRYRITNDDLLTALHQHDVLAVADVRRAYVEPDGEITVVKTAG